MKVLSRRVIGRVSVLMILALTVMTLFSTQVFAAESVEKSARSAVKAFFDSGLQKDFNVMVNNSIDNRSVYKSTSRHQLFDKQVKDFLGYKIQSVQEVDSTHATAIVEIRQKHLTVTMEYPVVFNGKNWLVDIDHSKDINSSYSSKTTSSTDKTVIDKTATSLLSYAYASWSTSKPQIVETNAFSGDSAYYISNASQSPYYVDYPNPHVLYILKEVFWYGSSAVDSVERDGAYNQDNFPPIVYRTNADSTYYLFITFADVNDYGPALLYGSIY